MRVLIRALPLGKIRYRPAVASAPVDPMSTEPRGQDCGGSSCSHYELSSPEQAKDYMNLKDILPWYGHRVICIYRIAFEMIGKSPCY